MSSEKSEKDKPALDLFGYGIEELYELLGSTYIATSLVITLKRERGIKKLKFKNSEEEDYTEIGKEMFDKYISQIRGTICKEWNKDKTRFREDKSAYDAIMKLIPDTDIPHSAGEIVGTIIIKMGFDKFCNNT